MPLRVLSGPEEKIQDRRYKKEAIFHNAQLTPSLLGKYCVLEKEAQEYLEEAFYKLEFSARAYHKILKVSRTIADLAGKDKIGQRHIAEAVCYRMLDKKYWGSEGE